MRTALQPWRRLLLIERQLRLTAQPTPNGRAVVRGDTTLTWRELDELTDRATIVIAPSFDVATIWQERDAHGITQLCMVPTMLAMGSADSGASVRRMCISTSTLPPALVAKIQARFPNVEMTVLYGASELGMITALHGHESIGRTGSVGLPRFGYSLKILDDAVPAPANAVRDGWVTPGDMGSLDEDGFLYLADRRSDLIISGGMNVYSAEVENTLVEVDGVQETVVIGVDDEVWGKRVTAVIVGEVREKELDAHCRERLAGYKIPAAVPLRRPDPAVPGKQTTAAASPRRSRTVNVVA